VAGIVGAVGLLSLLAAVEAGKRVLLANKEPLVMLGAEIMRRARASGAQVLPLDSEHNAIFQCLPVTEDRHNGRASGSYSAKVSGVKRIMLTGSGGPFRERAIDTFDAITVEEAVKHPNWQMGPKISVDSATMMNKGLEVIEAIHLFAVPVDKIDVVVHPQSVIHSMVEFIDGSVIAELATPDMRVPIAHALAWPQRIPSGAESLDFTQLGALTFDKPNENRFPCLRLAKEAVDRGGTATTVLNAANEVAVDAFLARQIRFTDIVHIIESSLSRAKIADSLSLDQVLQADVAARQIARECIAVSTAPSRKSLSSATPTPSRVYE
jgi:1-deoxy-D-xylulose-5-phosphate reductoisomerase